MTGEQLRAARAMLRLEQAELAEKAGVSLKTIKRLEAESGRLTAHSIHNIQQALEIAGIEFLDREGIRGRGEGVRFRSDRTAKLRRLIVEDARSWLEVNLNLKVQDDPDFFERPADEIVNVISDAIRDGVRRSVNNHVPAMATLQAITKALQKEE